MNKFLIALVALSLGLNLYAQQQEESLGDIIVTARKKKENLQEVPISATSFDEKKLEDAGIESVRDVADLTPNLTIIGSSSGRYITPYIRGQGSQDTNLPEEISVSFYLDEVPLPRYGFDNELIDIESIEVLRGPQGTLFGKNTMGGAVNIKTKEPSVEAGHKIVGEYGNLDTRAVTGTTNFKLFSDKLTNRLTLKYKERGGYIHDTLQNRDLGDMNVFAGSNSILFKPSETFKLTWKFGLQDEEGTDPLIVARNVTSGYPKTGQDIIPAYDNNLITTSLRAEKDFGDVVLTTIAAFNYHDFQVKYDEADYYITYDYLVSVGGTGLANTYINNPNFFFRDVREYDRQYFGEVRLSNKDTDLSWTTGVNVAKNNYRLISYVNTSRGATIPFIISQNIQLESTNISAFGETTKKLPKDFALTLGARLINDQKKFNSLHSSNALSYYEQHSKEDYTNYSAKVALAHKTTENINTYASVTRGYQSGGYPSYQFNNYNSLATDQQAYDDSSSIAYEIGMKSKLFGNRLRLNTAIFYDDIQDKQVRTKDPTTNLSYYANIDTDIYGVELESEFKFTRDIDFGLNVGYMETEFKEEATFNGNVVNGKGARVANIPNWSGSTYGQYSRYLAAINGVGFFRLTYKYNGSRYGDNNNLTKMGSYGLWNIRAGIDKERYSLFVYMDNIFNKLYESQAYYYTGLSTYVSSPALPRMYGVKATLRF